MDDAREAKMRRALVRRVKDASTPEARDHLITKFCQNTRYRGWPEEKINDWRAWILVLYRRRAA